MSDGTETAGQKGEDSAMLSVRHLCKSYTRGVVRRHRIDAVNDVSFSISKGTSMGIAGNSGCGKSTIARMVMGLVPPDAGAVFLDGCQVSGLRAGQMKQVRRQMQIIFQHPESSLDPHRKILESVLEAMEIHGVKKGRAEREARVEELFEMLGLHTRLFGRYPHQISGGEAQRIVIARALTLDPKVLILDEPTSMLDVSIQAHIMTLLKTLQQALGLTYLLISHDLEVLCWFCDRIGIMNQGRLIETGTKTEILERPEQAFTKELVESFFAF